MTHVAYRSLAPFTQLPNVYIEREKNVLSMADTVRRLPWGAERQVRSSLAIEPASSLDSTIKPGEYTLHLLLNQFFIAAEARIADVCSEAKQVTVQR